jgi:hypothetical protein
MTSECPPTRRRFYHEWDAIDYYYHKVLYWFYQQHDRRRALKFCAPLERILQEAAADHEAILGEAAWSLLYEVKGDLSKAIHYRQSEIKLIRRLWEISRGAPDEDIALEHYGPSDLSDRFDLLAILYHEAGDLDKALSVLQESKQLCDEHGVRFDGKDLLRDYLAEKKQLSSQTRPAAGKRKRHPA